MSWGTPTQPDFETQKGDGTQYATNLDNAIAVLIARGLAGFAPTEQDTPDMTVKIGAGTVYDSATGALVSVSAQSTGTITAPSTTARKDIVYIDPSDGSVGVATGAEDTDSPPTGVVDPDIPAGMIPIARVTLATSTTAISNSLGDDLRGALYVPPAGGFSGPGSSTDNAVPRFDGTGGATVQNSGVTIDDSNNLGGVATIELGHASDTTLSRSAAGEMAVEGKVVATLSTAQSFTKAQGTTPQVLSDGATITPDASLQNNGYVVLGGNRTLGVPSNMVAGKTQSFRINVYQDATGSRTLAYAWPYKWAGGSVGTLTTTALARDKLFGDINYYATATVTVTIATPGRFTWTAHGLKTGDQLQLTTTGALPTGLTASTTYFVIKDDADHFWLATTRANAAAATKINTSGSQSGVHTAVACEIDLALTKAYS